jgi:negative regulator of sigma E activity
MERVMQMSVSDPTEDGEEKRQWDDAKPFQSRWVPVAITALAVASVAAEIWGVIRGLSLIIGR